MKYIILYISFTAILAAAICGCAATSGSKNTSTTAAASSLAADNSMQSSSPDSANDDNTQKNSDDPSQSFLPFDAEDPLLIHGVATYADNMFTVDNQNPAGYKGSVSIPFGDDSSALLLDSSTGYPIQLSDFKNGDYIYAYTDEAMTMSIPPITNAKVIFRFSDPSSSAEFITADTADSDLPGSDMTMVKVKALNGKYYLINSDTELNPYRTKNIVTMQDIKPGSSMIIWCDYLGEVSKAMLFEEGYFQ